MIRVRSSMLLMVALLLGAPLLQAAQPQAPRSSRRGAMMRGSIIGLLSVEAVQKELKLSDDQVAKIREIGQKLRAESREQYAGLRDIEDAQKRRAKMTELRDQADQKAREQIREVLQREQIMRLYQIRLQVRGAVYGLNNRYVAGRLELTDEQKKKAAEIEKATTEKVFAAYRGLRDLGDEQRRQAFAEAREKIGKIHADAEKQALGLLTAEQKEAFEKMKGEKFEF